MRITKGRALGHSIRFPKAVSDLRPTTSLVRKAIFDILGEKTVKAICLDLFAGTGSLGLEALSREAKTCDFVDRQKNACEVVKKNLNHSQFLGRGQIFCQTAENFILNRPLNNYDLILMDPPYALEPFNLIARLAPILKENGLIVYLHSKSTNIPEISSLQFEQTRVYGDTAVSFLTKKL